VEALLGQIFSTPLSLSSDPDQLLTARSQLPCLQSACPQPATRLFSEAWPLPLCFICFGRISVLCSGSQPPTGMEDGTREHGEWHPAELREGWQPGATARERRSLQKAAALRSHRVLSSAGSWSRSHVHRLVSLIS